MKKRIADMEAGMVFDCNPNMIPKDLIICGRENTFWSLLGMAPTFFSEIFLRADCDMKYEVIGRINPNGKYEEVKHG